MLSLSLPLLEGDNHTCINVEGYCWELGWRQWKRQQPIDKQKEKEEKEENMNHDWLQRSQVSLLRLGQSWKGREKRLIVVGWGINRGVIIKICLCLDYLKCHWVGEWEGRGGTIMNDRWRERLFVSSMRCADSGRTHHSCVLFLSQAK